jgi:hypothetical protein
MNNLLNEQIDILFRHLLFIVYLAARILPRQINKIS